jgi:hypothetical protein
VVLRLIALLRTSRYWRLDFPKLLNQIPSIKSEVIFGISFCLIGSVSEYRETSNREGSITT